MAKMTTEEAFVKVLQMHGIEHSFGIIGSAFMPISGTGYCPDTSVSHRLKHTCHQKYWSLPLCLTMLGSGDINININPFSRR